MYVTMGIIHRQDPRRSRRKIKVPPLTLPTSEAPWSNEESDEDPSYIPTSQASTDDGESTVSLVSDDDGDDDTSSYEDLPSELESVVDDTDSSSMDSSSTLSDN